MLKNCRHCFCKTCLLSVIENKNYAGDVLCPMKIEVCEKSVTDEEVQALLTPEAYHKFLQKVFTADQRRNTNTMPILLQLEDVEFVENKVEFECGICMTVIAPGDGIMLKNCLHEYCKTCLAGVIEASEELEVPCPFVAESGTHCEGKIQDRELRSLVQPEVYAKHLARSLELAEATTKNSFHCKTVDCPGWVEFEDGATTYPCSVCLKINCIKCKAIHEGKSCTDYYYDTNEGARKRRDDGLTEAQVQELITNQQAMACPGCGVIIQKTVGCNHMTCSRCKREFQWLGRQ